MSRESERILKMVAKGKLSVEEAENLLEALNKGKTEEEHPRAESKNPAFLYVQVENAGEDNVHVKVPLSLLRAGMRLTSLIPPQAMDQINDSMEKHGMSIDLNNLKKDDIESLIESLKEMEVNVQSKNGDKVKVYCA